MRNKPHSLGHSESYLKERGDITLGTSTSTYLLYTCRAMRVKCLIRSNRLSLTEQNSQSHNVLRLRLQSDLEGTPKPLLGIG
jgi:hypothetical protein